MIVFIEANKIVDNFQEYGRRISCILSIHSPLFLKEKNSDVL